MRYSIIALLIATGVIAIMVRAVAALGQDPARLTIVGAIGIYPFALLIAAFLTSTSRSPRGIIIRQPAYIVAAVVLQILAVVILVSGLWISILF